MPLNDLFNYLGNKRVPRGDGRATTAAAVNWTPTPDPSRRDAAAVAAAAAAVVAAAAAAAAAAGDGGDGDEGGDGRRRWSDDYEDGGGDGARTRGAEAAAPVKATCGLNGRRCGSPWRGRSVCTIDLDCSSRPLLRARVLWLHNTSTNVTHGHAARRQKERSGHSAAI